MKTYKIVKIKYPEPHHCQWMEGYHAIVARKDGRVDLCRVNEEAQPNLFPDGRFMVNTGISSNPSIHETNLLLVHDNDKFYAIEK